MIRSGLRRGTRAIGQLSARAWLWIGYAGFLLWSFPGYMSVDSEWQLFEGRTGQRADPHPPIMAFLWGWLDKIVTGPVLMLLLQGAVFLLGTAALLRRAMSPRAAAIGAAAVLWFPPNLTTMALIWKDSQMAAYLLGGAALLISERRSHRLLGLAVVTLGCAFRHNGFAAAVPLVFALFAWRPGLRWFQRYAIAAIASIAMVVTAMGTNRLLTVEHAFLSPAVIDIVGVLAFTHDRSDDDLREVLRGTPLLVQTGIQAKARQVYSPRNPYGIDHGDAPMFGSAQTDAQRAALNRAWREIVTSDWRAYFAFRVAGFLELNGVTANPPFGPVYNSLLDWPENYLPMLRHHASHSRSQLKLNEWLRKVADTPVYRPYIYVAIALLLLVLCCRDRLSFALLGSGLVYQLSFFPAGGTPDFRYSHWMIATTCIAVALIFAQRWRGVKVTVP